MQDTTYSNDVDMTDAPPASTTEHHDSMSDAARVTANYKGSLSSESGVVPSIEITDSTGAALPFRMGWLNTRSTPHSDPPTPTFSPITPPLHLLPTSTPHAPSFSPMVPPPQPQSTSTSAQANTPFNFEEVQDRNKEEVKDRIFSEVLVHSYPVELHRKRFFRLTTEQGKPSVLTVGMGKSERTPENRHIVPRGLNTNSPTNLLLVSVAFCARGLRIYYGNNNFVFGSFKELDEWLQNIQARRMFVRNLTLRSTWEVGFTKSEVRPEMLRMDHLGGIVTTPTMHAFQFLTSITLNIHCIQQLERWDLKTRNDALAKEPKAAEMSQEFARWSAERVLEAYRERRLHGRNIETSVKVTFIRPPVTDFGKSFTKGPNKTLIVKEMEKPVFKHQFPPLTMDDL